MARESIFVVRQARQDRLSSGGGAPTETEVSGCTVVPLMNGGEETFQGQIVTADFFVKTPPGTDVKADDKVRIRGELCEVDGAPADYGRKGVLFQAQRVGTV